MLGRSNGPARVLRPRLADDLRRYAEHERPRRRRKALRQDGPGPDDRLLADHVAAHQDGSIGRRDGGGNDERVRYHFRRLAPVAVKRHVVKNMPMRTRDLRVTGYRPLVPPAILLEELPLSEEGSRAVARARADLLAIIDGEDDRLVAIFGPCSIHDPVAAFDYARPPRALGDEIRGEVVVVMRAYFMKPRTSVGWKGLVSDPHRDGSFRINDGLRMTRRLLLDLVEIGVPAACEFVDPISPQYTSDLVTWAAIGARTTESQVHRELASGLSFPVGFKNGTDGNVQIAIDAVRAASQPHSFMGVTEQGLAAIVETGGNPSAHIVLRGGTTGANHDAASVQRALAALGTASCPARLMIDLSHGNSGRDHLRQLSIAKDVAAQIASGERGIVGVMAESFIEDGRQDSEAVPLVYGKSITDPCIGWDRSVDVLRSLADAVRARRSTPTSGPTTPPARSADNRTRAPSRS